MLRDLNQIRSSSVAIGMTAAKVFDIVRFHLPLARHSIAVFLRRDLLSARANVLSTQSNPIPCRRTVSDRSPSSEKSDSNSNGFQGRQVSFPSA